MPYLRMFLGEQQIDEVYISEVLMNSVLSLHIVDEEKQSMLKQHANLIRNSEVQPIFYLDSVPSAVNNFTPLQIKKNS